MSRYVAIQPRHQRTRVQHGEHGPRRPSANGSLLMTVPFRPAVVLALCLLVAACGGGGPSFPGSSPAPLSGPPTNLTIDLTPLGEALLRWMPPTPEPARAPVTGYAVYLESPDGQAPQRLAVTGATSYLYSGLLPGRTYVFHIRAVSDVGFVRGFRVGGCNSHRGADSAPAAPRVADCRVDREQSGISAVDGVGPGTGARAGHGLRGLPRAARWGLPAARRDRVVVVYLLRTTGSGGALCLFGARIEALPGSPMPPRRRSSMFLGGRCWSPTPPATWSPS